MKIQCNACEAAEASVLCCADEAALCRACDEMVHAANKLAGKHQRVALSTSSSHMPTCDICQETTGYFFCLEDRALLCRKCDVAIHTTNSYVAGHQRFLLTGVKVGLEPSEAIVPSSNDILNSSEKFKERTHRSVSRKDNSALKPRDSSVVISCQSSGDIGLQTSKVSFPGTVPAAIPEWPLEDFLGLPDFNQNYVFMDQGSSKADSSKLEDSEFSPFYRSSADDDVEIDGCISQVPEIPRTVPEMPSPPTASGLHWPRNWRDSYLVDNSMFVPDICSLHSPHRHHQAGSKRRRQSHNAFLDSWA